MGMLTTDRHNLRELYIETVKRALNSERQIADKGLPAMIEKSTNPQLLDAFRNHLVETRNHIVRLERILDAQTGEADDARCQVTSSLISTAESNLSDAENNILRDVILLAAGSQVEHHEMAVYGTLRTWAEVLGESQDAALLDRTLQEEENADALLTRLSQRINISAVEPHSVAA
jgi:ferritin-like metal-binding protein YciE